MVSQIYRNVLQLIKANSSDTETPFVTWACPLLMAYFHLKFMINGTIVILK